jgi:oligopeptidase B
MIAPMLHSLARFVILLCCPAFAASAAEPWPGPGPHPGPPIAQIVPHVVNSAHGQRDDEYHWLRDDSPQTKRPEILRHLEAENAYTAAMMAPLAGLRATLVAEMRQRIPAQQRTPAVYQAGWWWWLDYPPGAEHAQRWRQRGTPEAPDVRAKPQLLLDDNVNAAGHAYYSVAAWAVSPDGRQLAWAEDTSGRGVLTLRFKDLSSGRVWPDVLPGALDQLAWANDNRTLFYIQQDPVTLNNGPVMAHRLGRVVSADRQVFEEADRTRFVTLHRSASGRKVRIAVDDYDSSETWALNADAPAAPPRRVLARRPGVRHDADHWQGRWFIRTNESERNFRLVSVPQSTPDDRRQWHTLVQGREQFTLERFVLLRRGIAVQERHLADTRVRWLGRTPAVPAPTAEPGTQITLGDHLDAAAAHLRYTVESMVQPPATWDLHLASGQRILRQQRQVPGYDASRYASARLFVPARDGKAIPVTLAWRTDRARRDGRAPLWLFGYGAYGISMDPDFSANRLSLMDRGFVVGIAHVRGGAEMGEDWYEQGRGLHKPNSFNDYIDATQALVKVGWADPKRVFAVGGSAGGLLMGAVANQAPQLYRGMVLAVPFVDVLSTMLDESIPLTTQEWSQWGDPRQKPAYEAMLAYSPYDNIRAMAYPAMLVTTGLWDGNVQYHEPAKYVARLRARKTDQQPLLFHVNLNAGHGGAAGRFEALDELALEFAFVIGLAGLQDAAP